MKLSALFSFHIIVYVGLVILASSAKLFNPTLPQKLCVDAKAKQEVVASNNHPQEILHSELLFKY